MVMDFRSRLFAGFLLGLMALVVTPRELLHHCDAHDHVALEAEQAVHADEDCAICQAIVGHMLPVPAQEPVTEITEVAPQASTSASALIETRPGIRAPRGPPACA